MAAPYYGMNEEVHVMLVDNDEAFVTETVDLLKFYDYKVTTVGTTSRAMTMLSNGKKKIDAVIINVHSSNPFSFEFLAQAVTLDIILIFVCDEYNKFLVKNALDNGAYLYLKKPFDAGIVKYLWQFVLGKKIQSEKAKEESEKNEDKMNVENNEEQYEERKDASHTEGQRNIIHEVENDIVSNGKHKMRKKRRRKNLKDINEGESQRSVVNKVVRRKTCTKWTKDLHGIFSEAVQQLGEGRCYPKEILEEMNVPDLTRMQVASHLQKCRMNNWRALDDRKYIHHPSGQASSSGSQQKRSFKKFETMPCLQINVLNQQRNSNQVQRDPKFSFPTISSNNAIARGVSPIQQLYCPQLQVAGTSNIQFPEITDYSDESSK